MISVLFSSIIALSKNKAQRLAVIDGYQWASKNKKLEQALNARLDPDGPGGEDPDPDLNAAQEAIDAYGGEIIKRKPNPDPPKGAIL